MNSKALVLAAATVGVTVVTFVALNLAAPISHADELRPEGVTAEQVFSASIAEPGASSPANTAFQSEGQMDVAIAQDAGGEVAPEAAASTPPPEAAPATSEAPTAPAVAGGSCAMGVSGGTPVVVPAAGVPGGPAAEGGSEPMEVAQAETAAPAPAAEPAPAPEAAPMDAAPAEAAPMEAAAMPAEDGSAPAGGGVTEAAGACSTGMTDPNAQPIVVVAQGVPGGPAAPPSDGGMAPPAPADVAAVEPGDAAPAPAPEPAPAEPSPPPPAPEPAPAPVQPEPKAEPAPAPKPAPKPAAKPKPKSVAPKVAPPEAKVAWWPAKQAGKLNVVYAGEANFTKAIVLMFDGQFDNADSANQNIKVTPKKGGQVNGQWMVAKGNPSMLLLNVDPGLYSVEIGSGLADKGGRAVSKASSGVVFVH